MGPKSCEPMEAWRKAWRTGFAPQLSDAGLEALAKALEQDDPSLLQGSTTSPPPLECMRDWPVAAACAVGLCGWKGEKLEIVRDVEGYFASICFGADKLLNDPGACRHFLNWFDDTPRQRMRNLLLPEVRRELERRQQVNVAA